MESKGDPYVFFFVAHVETPYDWKMAISRRWFVGFIASAPKREMKMQQFGGPRLRVGGFPKDCLHGGFKYFLFSSLPGEMIQFD